MCWKAFIVQLIPCPPKDNKVFAAKFVDPRTGKTYIGEDQLPIGACWLGLESGIWGIKLPGNHGYNRFCPTLEYEGHTWEVGGEWPYITVTPSVNSVREYHGTIIGGVISADLDGRRFNDFGLRRV